MDYKTGFNIKPNKVTKLGQVIFTDGTNDVVPNQLACEAYGYRYNSATGTCNSYNFNEVYNSKLATPAKDNMFIEHKK